MTTTSISKSSLLSNIWRNFYDRVKDQVTSVTISISPGTQTIQTYATSYSDVNFESKDDFPILVINTPKIPQEQFTFGKTQLNGVIEFEIYATNSQAADKFLDAVNAAIETYKYSFAGVGLKQLELDDIDVDFIEYGNIKAHIRTARWKFIYYFDRTGAF